MHTTNALRRAALATGCLLIAQGVAAALTRQNESYAGTTGDLLSDGLLAVGLIAGLVPLNMVRKRTTPRWGMLAMAGEAAIALAIVATIAAGRDILDGLYIAGTAAWIAGLIAIAVHVVRHRQAELRPAIALPLASLVALALTDAGGAILLGVAWIVLQARVADLREIVPVSG
jgi:hypothetical protein